MNFCKHYTSVAFVLAADHCLCECKFCSGEVTFPVGILYSLRFFPASNSISVPVRVAAQLLAGRPNCTGERETNKKLAEYKDETQRVCWKECACVCVCVCVCPLTTPRRLLKAMSVYAESKAAERINNLVVEK